MLGGFSSSLKKARIKLLCEMEAKGGKIETNTKLIANLQFYHDSMVLHESLLQWYRTMLIAFEAATFASVYFLIDQQELCAIPFLTAIGIGGCFLWPIVCKQRVNLVNKQRDEIGKLISNSDLCRWFDVYKDNKLRYLAQFFFNWVLPGLLTIMWIYLILTF